MEQTKFLLDEAQLPRRCRASVPREAEEAGEERTILVNLSGHGHFDIAAYDNCFAGELEDVALDEEAIERALHAIEGLPTPA